MQGDTGRYGEALEGKVGSGDTGRCGEMWGDMGRRSRAKVGTTKGELGTLSAV